MPKPLPITEPTVTQQEIDAYLTIYPEQDVFAARSQIYRDKLYDLLAAANSVPDLKAVLEIVLNRF